MSTGTTSPRLGPWVAIAAGAVGLAAALYLSSRGMTNVYGDGIAHLNIARKVVDSRDVTLWQRYMQLGSPWLPLPHLLALPFVWNDALWRSGWAGTIPSLASFVAAVWLTYRLGFELYGRERPALFCAAAVGLNPSVLYMASTPMTELPFVALLLASALATAVWARRRSRASLVLSALLVAATTLTRYEGWALVPAGALVVLILSKRRLADAALWCPLAASGILVWLWHNYAIFGDPLEFLRGPYSARAVAAAHEGEGGWGSFVVGNPLYALGWGLLTVAVAAGPLTVVGAVAGLAARAVRRGREIVADLPALLVVAPFCLLVFSLFRGEAQISPLERLGLLNVRYGVSYVATAALLVPAMLPRGARRRAALGLLAALVAVQYAAMLSRGPSGLPVYREAFVNNVQSEQWRDLAAVSGWLAEHPPSGLVLMDGGYLGPVIARSGLTFRRVVCEGTAEWGDWLETGALPAGVTTVVMRDGDLAWTRLRDDPAFAAEFHRAYAVGDSPALEVWTIGRDTAR